MIHWFCRKCHESGDIENGWTLEGLARVINEAHSKKSSKCDFELGMIAVKGA